MISCSVVLFHNNDDELEQLISKVRTLDKVYLVDNSLDSSVSSFISKQKLPSHFEYIKNNKNIGYGKGHNVAINKLNPTETDIHLILNADVNFDRQVVDVLSEYLNKHKDVVCVAPKVKYPDGRKQYLVKAIPTPLNLIVRRFIPFKSIVKKMDYKYELRFFPEEKYSVPIVSGCFIFVKAKALVEVGGFDPRFFMYLEDFDLSRRLLKKGKIIYNPEVEIVHNFAKGSYRSVKLLKYHIKSAISYFNKWGWFFDADREARNKELYSQFDISKEKRGLS